MVLIEWKEEFETGVVKIDEQHKELIRLINQVHFEMAEGKEKSSLIILFEELFNYVMIHFATEEQMMKKYRYEEFENHQKQHIKLKENMLKKKTEYEEKKIILSMRIMILLKEWLQNHILETDLKFADYMKSNRSEK